MLDPELKDLLQKNLEASKETLDVVKGMRSTQRWGSFFVVVKWAIIIAISFGSYYYIQPYLNQMLDAYGVLNNSLNDLQETTKGLSNTASSTGDAMNRLKSLMNNF